MRLCDGNVCGGVVRGSGHHEAIISLGIYRLSDPHNVPAGSGDCHPHFIDEQSEAQTGSVTFSFY